MAAITKNYIVVVDGVDYILTQDLFKTFCLYAQQLVTDFNDDTTELNFRLTYNVADWIGVERTGADSFVIETSGGDTETLTLIEFNTLMSICRTSRNCKC